MGIDTDKIKALCFDVDGTLSDTDDQFVERIVRFLNPIRFIFSNNDSRPFARKIVTATETPGNYLYGIPDRLGLDDEIASLGDFIFRLGLGKTREPFLLIPGLKDTLKLLQPSYLMSVVSARGERSTMRFLNQFDLTPFFVFIATAQTCVYTKPYPDPILWAAKKMGVSPQECLMIGDTIVDIRAAQAAGAQSIGVLCGFGEKEELINSGANLIIDHTAQLPNVLNS